jgi:hypothetical protein
VEAENPLRGYGNQRNYDIGHWLDDMNLTEGRHTKDWQAVEREMDQARARYQSLIRSQPGNTIPGGWGAPEGGGSGGKGGGPGPAGAGGGEAKAAGAEGHAIGAEGKAMGAEVKGLGAEAQIAGAEGKALGAEAKALGAEVKGGRALAIAGRVGSKIYNLLELLALPGPQDVLFMFLSAFASIAEAKAALKHTAFATGFAQGVAAAITGTPADQATEALMYKSADPEMGERVAGFTKIRERGTNEGIKAGWKFGHNLNSAQRNGFLTTAFTEMAGNKKTLKGDFGRDDLIDIGIALRPTFVKLINEAIEQEAWRQLQERQKWSHRPWR